MDAASPIIVAKHTLEVFAAILLGGTLSGFLAQKLRVPDVVVFLFAGVALGPHALGRVDIGADSPIDQLILIFGSCYILFDGGASLRVAVLQRVWITIVALATLGVLITALITALVAQWMLSTPFLIALLLASAIASTDPATLVPIFRQIKIKDRVTQTVISESAFNDATGAILTFTVLGLATGSGELNLAHAGFELLKQSVLGIGAGVILGYLAALLIAHERYNFLLEYAPAVTLMAVIGTYMGADNLNASGFMAVFVSGIVLGNKEAFGFKLERGESHKLEDFIVTTSLIMRMFIFILLGAQLDFVLMRQYLIPGIMITLAFMFIARPATVLLCAAPDRRARWSLQELLFMCWKRETGVMPAALAGLLLGMHAPNAEMIASVTFIVIMTTIVVQATTTRWLASRLDLLEE